jgi:hypothetical protein
MYKISNDQSTFRLGTKKITPLKTPKTIPTNVSQRKYN